MLQQAASGDSLPGEVLKFQQRPLDGPTYSGHDVLSTATRSGAGYQGSFVADDFADRVSQPVLHISWWGSYLENLRFNGANSFLISFATDVPASPSNPFSHPGAAIQSQVVRRGPLAPGSGTFTETFLGGAGAENLYRYNAELNLGLEFAEQANTVYWLTIAALIDDPLSEPPFQWGWHVRDYTIPDPLASTAPAVVPGESQIGPGIWHFQDDAVSGSLLLTDLLNVNQSGYVPQNYTPLVDGPADIGNYSMDLAFELYSSPSSVPDAGSSLLLISLALGGLGFFARMRRS
jgi:hypothetical protein